MITALDILRFNSKSPKALLDFGYDETAYLEMRRQYIETDGRISLASIQQISGLHPMRSDSAKSGKNFLNAESISSNCDRLNSEGYSVEYLPYSYRLDSQVLCRHLDQLEATHEGSARYFQDSLSVLRQFPIVNRMLKDTSIKEVADTYLQCNSLVNKVTAWKTIFSESNHHSLTRDAMLYHFDLDHLNFLKVFIYLDDVDEENGPHMYIPCTSARFRWRLPPSLRRDGRFTDDELARNDLVGKPIYGPSGTLIFADTQNFHKGLPVSRSGRSRYMLQLQFTSSLFGAKQSHTRAELAELNPLYVL